MIFKTIFLTLFFLTYSCAGIQSVSIGTIDSYYGNKISEEELKEIIKQIEKKFETPPGHGLRKRRRKGSETDFPEPSRIQLSCRRGYKNHTFAWSPKSDGNDSNMPSKMNPKSITKCFAGISENTSKTSTEKSPKCMKTTSGNEPTSHLKSMKIRTWTPRVFRILTFMLRGGAGVPPTPRPKTDGNL